MTTRYYAVHEDFNQTRLLIPSRKYVYHASQSAAERALVRYNNQGGFLGCAGNRGLIWSNQHPDALVNHQWQYIYTVAL